MRKTLKQNMYHVDVDQQNLAGEFVDGADVAYEVLAPDPIQAAHKAAKRYQRDMWVGHATLQITVTLKTDTVYLL